MFMLAPINLSTVVMSWLCDCLACAAFPEAY